MTNLIIVLVFVIHAVRSIALYAGYLTRKIGVSGCVRAFTIAVPVAALLIGLLLSAGFAIVGGNLNPRQDRTTIEYIFFALYLLSILSGLIAVLIGHQILRIRTNADSPHSSERLDDGNAISHQQLPNETVQKEDG